VKQICEEVVLTFRLASSTTFWMKNYVTSASYLTLWMEVNFMDIMKVACRIIMKVSDHKGSITRYMWTSHEGSEGIEENEKTRKKIGKMDKRASREKFVGAKDIFSLKVNGLCSPYTEYEAVIYLTPTQDHKSCNARQCNNKNAHTIYLLRNLFSLHKKATRGKAGKLIVR
ncbi:hypothetical protein M8C21_016600, partial [Ambrosia artemisiifolia]